ncbi:MAG: fumarate hydratase [Eubacteriales bacterium]
MREISAAKIGKTVKQLFLKAALCPGEDCLSAIKYAAKTEKSPYGKAILDSLIKNADTAKETGMPYCQDTGMAVVFLDIGQDVHISGDIESAVNSGVAAAYEEGFFRKSVLDPITRVNTKDNTPAIIHYFIVPGDKIRVTVAPKGFGSENMSVLKMLNPSDGINGIKKLVTESVLSAGGSPCPPIVLGIGIGGDFEKCALMAKKQLLRDIGSKNPDSFLANLEQTLKDDINALGLGPMAMGGSNYCLAVHIDKYPTHIAGLPVAINFQCHASRHAFEEI